MTNEFEGRVAIVTGASSGIGLETAERLVADGARVAIFSRSGETLATIAARHEGKTLAIGGDVADPSDLGHLFAETEARLGTCDLLVNCAGMVDPKRIEATSIDDWDRMFAVNVRSAFLTARLALPGMIAHRRGTIVNVSSISGVIGPEKFPGFVSYCAAKGALISMTEALAVEVKEHGIRVNCVSPGSVDTAMLRAASATLAPDMSAAEVAEVILFLASDRSRPMNGQNVHVYSA
jgi:3-oxoacyl-[acyl-carrier protein] reductase